jgi:hypothetical protein
MIVVFSIKTPIEGKNPGAVADFSTAYADQNEYDHTAY